MATVVWIGESDENVLDILRGVFDASAHRLLIPASQAAAGHEIAQADYLLAGAGTLGPELIGAAARLKLIQRVGAGIDGIDLAVAAERQILVANLPGANSVAVAELTVAGLLACARQLVPIAAATASGAWEPNTRLLQSFELGGKTVALVGLGRIGQDVARRLRAFDMRLRYYDVRRQPESVEAELGIEFVELDELLAGSDVLAVHAPLTAETRGMINAARLAQLNHGAIVLNMSRAGIVDGSALVRALDSGRVAGAAIDVWPSEPADPDDPLLRHPNVVATPHLGAQTRDTVHRVFQRSLANIESHASGGPVEFLIESPARS